jgi:hypothetical protein
LDVVQPVVLSDCVGCIDCHIPAITFLSAQNVKVNITTRHEATKILIRVSFYELSILTGVTQLDEGWRFVTGSVRGHNLLGAVGHPHNTVVIQEIKGVGGIFRGRALELCLESGLAVL